MNTKSPQNSVLIRNRVLRTRLPAQRGAVLIVALVILVVLTLLGLSSVHTVTLEERMTSNTLDRALAFQAAEAALRQGEKEIRAGTCSGSGLDVAQLLADAGNQATATPPENLTVECLKLGTAVRDYRFHCDGDDPASDEFNCMRYLVTATSFGADRAEVVLETIYVVPYGG